jgi:xanthosine utilization system XapX-like protein
MPSEFPMHDPQNIWQNQPKEPFKMSMTEIRGKARQRRRRARSEALIEITSGLAVCVFFAWTFARANELLPRAGVGLLSLWGMYVAYQAYRWIWPGRPGPDATVSTSLEFYRSELERRRDYALHIWRRAGLTFCFLGAAMVVLPGLIKSLGSPRLLLNFAPLFALLAIWLAIFFPKRKRRLRKLQQEIDELRTFETEGRS